MMRNECGRNSDVLSAIRAGWCNGELQVHIDSCGSCAQLYEVAGMIFEEGRASARQADVPASGAVWWRMQLRKRREVSRKAERTLTVVQAVSLALALLIALAVFGSRLLFELSRLESVSTFTPAGIALAVGLASLLLISSFGFWFALGEERPGGVRSRRS